jgi:2-methylcitrate dehydratase PrpD
VPNYTEQLAKFAADLRWDQLPPEVVDKIKAHLLDTLGVSLRASQSLQSRQTVAAMEAAGMGGAPDCTVFGNSLKASVLEAAFLNSTMGHVLDFDDVHKFLHPSAAIVPAALAVAEREKSNGRQLILGLVAAYEISIRVSLAAGVQHRDRGYSPTGTCNHFGTAAAASILLGLDDKQIAPAFGISGNQAGGLTQHQYGGGHTKHLNSAIAARSGVFASLLARENFRAPTDIIEGELGFLNVLSDGGSPELLTNGLNEDFTLMWTNLKPYPSCRQGHGAVDLAIQAVQQNGLSHGDIESITLHTYPFAHAPWFSSNEVPANEVEAALRTPFALATAFIHGKITLESFTPSRIEDPEIHGLLKRITVLKDDTLATGWPDKRRVRLEIALKDGRKLKLATDNPKGSADYPLSFDEVAAKFSDLTAPVLPPKQINEVIKRVSLLEDEDDISDFTALLSTNPNANQSEKHFLNIVGE